MKFETKYQKPAEVKNEGFKPIHLFKTYNEKGEVVGFAELHYFGGKPAFYYIQNLGNTTTHDSTVGGVGNELITQINNFLDSKKTLGYLANTSEYTNLYTDRGWKQSKISPEFNYYGELTQQAELEILERLSKHFSKV